MTPMTTITLDNTPDPVLDEPAAPIVNSEDVGLFPVRLRLPETVIVAGHDACEDWFWEVCLANQDHPWRMELTSDGVLEIMAPTYAPSDEHEGESFGELRQWNINHGRPGTATGSSSAYRLANGAVRCPDAAWSPRAKVLPPPHETPRARPYCPDFVIEVRSTSQARPSDLVELLNKMQEYMENGSRLGWLIDPIERTVRVYRAGVDDPELLTEPETLVGEEVLPGFTFAVRELIFDLT